MCADRRVEHPLDVVSVGDIVDVRVMEVDVPKARISLSMILDEKEAANRKTSVNRPQGQKGGQQNRKNDNRASKKKDGLNLGGLSKFMR